MEEDDESFSMHPPSSTIPHMTPEPWTLTLCITSSQITVCPPRQLKIPVVHVSHWETSFVLVNCTHTHAHTGPIQQPFSHLVCSFLPLWHCLWKHVHLVLPCLAPLAMVPITHILSPLHSLFSSFFPSLYIPLHSHSSGNCHSSLLGSILLLPPATSWHIALSFPHGEHNMLPPPFLWMKLCLSHKNNKINQASALPFIFTLFTLSSVPLGCKAAVSLILWLFHVLPLFIWLPPEVISRAYGREVPRRETFMSLSSGIRVSCLGKSNKAPSTYCLLLVDPGIKPSSCSACKPGKAHISCIHHHPHIQPLSRLLRQSQHVWHPLPLSSRNPDFTFYLIKQLFR